MNTTPFTFEEATDIWDDFEDLNDTEFNLGTSTEYLVQNVVIAPFAAPDKEKFIAIYEQTRNSDQALATYEGTEFDVMLVVYDVNNESELTYIDIRTFAAQKGIKYSFPENV